jgi:hypothetical protein
VFHRLGRFEITEEEINQAIQVHDIGRDNQLSFAEFKRIFFEDTILDIEKQIKPLEIDFDEFVSSNYGTVSIKNSKASEKMRSLFG